MLKVKEHVSDLILLDVADTIMRLFSYEKYSVMKAIMIDLAKNENFEDYKAYINDPASYARQWIMAFINKTIFEESIGDQTRYCKLADYRLKAICTQLEKTYSILLNTVKEKKMLVYINGLTHFWQIFPFQQFYLCQKIPLSISKTELYQILLI